MSELDALPADQRAVLQLLLKQGKTYAELSTLLAIDAAAVQTRAHDALDAIGSETTHELPSERRGQVGDYLLGQQAAGEREASREYLGGSPQARTWARVVAGALGPMAAEPLPHVPEEAAPEPAVELVPEPAAAAPVAPVAEAPIEEEPAAAAPPRSSRLGGALLLGGVGVLVAIALVLILGGGGSGGKKTNSVSSTATQSTAQPSPLAQINLMPNAGSKSVGLAQVFAQGSQRLLIVAAQSLPPGSYALWLYNSAAQARLLGFVPQKVDKQGRFVTQGVLPQDARSFQSLVVTKEQVTRGKVPTRPGAIVLRGKLQTG